MVWTWFKTKPFPRCYWVWTRFRGFSLIPLYKEKFFSCIRRIRETDKPRPTGQPRNNVKQMDKPNSKRWAWVTPRTRERKTAPEGSTYGNDSRYNRKAWLTLRAQVLQAEPLCRECSKRGRVEAAAMVDHIEPVTAGGAFYDWDNLQPLCNSCHAKKSACEGNAKKRKNAL